MVKVTGINCLQLFMCEIMHHLPVTSSPLYPKDFIEMIYVLNYVTLITQVLGKIGLFRYSHNFICITAHLLLSFDSFRCIRNFWTCEIVILNLTLDIALSFAGAVDFIVLFFHKKCGEFPFDLFVILFLRCEDN
jgi:hypothetical protein